LSLVYFFCHFCTVGAALYPLVLELNTSRSQFKKVYQIPSLQRKMEDNF